MIDQSDPIQMGRRALFEAGGLTLVRDGERPGKGKMVPTSPEFRDRADAYNALADLHARLNVDD